MQESLVLLLPRLCLMQNGTWQLIRTSLRRKLRLPFITCCTALKNVARPDRTLTVPNIKRRI